MNTLHSTYGHYRSNDGLPLSESPSPGQSSSSRKSRGDADRDETQVKATPEGVPKSTDTYSQKSSTQGLPPIPMPSNERKSSWASVNTSPLRQRSIPKLPKPAGLESGSRKSSWANVNTSPMRPGSTSRKTPKPPALESNDRKSSWACLDTAPPALGTGATAKSSQQLYDNIPKIPKRRGARAARSSWGNIDILGMLDQEFSERQDDLLAPLEECAEELEHSASTLVVGILPASPEPSTKVDDDKSPINCSGGSPTSVTDFVQPVFREKRQSKNRPSQRKASGLERTCACVDEPLSKANKGTGETRRRGVLRSKSDSPKMMIRLPGSGQRKKNKDKSSKSGLSSLFTDHEHRRTPTRAFQPQGRHV
jgi:hypothetical protein